MIIIDLDDTIFETGSMNPRIFESAISIIIEYFENENPAFKSKLESDLWSFPIDYLISKYSIPPKTIERFYNKITDVDYSVLSISPYADYKFLKHLNLDKILVTTGLKELQNAKIKALDIERDFQSIHIDDPRLSPRNTKFNIFSKILKQSNKPAQDFIVIGDNPDSEIKAGHALGMQTIQRKSKTKRLSDLADHIVDSFDSIKTIINQ